MLTKFENTTVEGVSIRTVLDRGMVSVSEHIKFQDEVAGGYSDHGTVTQLDSVFTITKEDVDKIEDPFDIIYAALEIDGIIGVVNGKEYAQRLQTMFDEELADIAKGFKKRLKLKGFRQYEDTLMAQGFAEDVEHWIRLYATGKVGIEVREESAAVTYKETEELNKIGLPVGTVIHAGGEALRVVGQDVDNPEKDIYVVLEKENGELLPIPAHIILDSQVIEKEEPKTLSFEEEMEMMRKKNEKSGVAVHTSKEETPAAAPKEEKKVNALEAFLNQGKQIQTNNIKEEVKMTQATKQLKGATTTQGGTEMNNTTELTKGQATRRLGTIANNQPTTNKGENTMNITTPANTGAATRRLGGAVTAPASNDMGGFGVPGVQLPGTSSRVANTNVAFTDVNLYRGGQSTGAGRQAWYAEVANRDARVKTNLIESRRNMDLGIEQIDIFDPVAMFNSGKIKFEKPQSCVAIVEITLAGGTMVMPFDIHESSSETAVEAFYSPNIKRVNTRNGWKSKYQISASNKTVSTVTCTCGKKQEVKDGDTFKCACGKEMVMASNRAVFNNTTKEQENVEIKTNNYRKQLLPFGFQIDEELLAQVMVFVHEAFGIEL